MDGVPVLVKTGALRPHTKGDQVSFMIDPVVLTFGISFQRKPWGSEGFFLRFSNREIWLPPCSAISDVVILH